MSPLCGSYDVYTGDCLGCASPLTHDVVAGECVPRNATCTARQWRNASVCVDVPAACSAFDPQTGACLSCVDATFELLSGVCSKPTVVCAANEFAVGANCVPVPAECFVFDRERGVCSFCVPGYFVEGGVCRRVQCPPGQTPSRFGLFCVDVSPLCATADPVSGRCLSCRSASHVLSAAGACVQAVSPLAGCRARERLGFGPCRAQENCRVYSLGTGECERCEDGFETDFRGVCARAVECGAAAWAVNGECLAFPADCAAVDSVGLCSRCADGFRVEAGRCVRARRCGAREFLSGGGECVGVSEGCLDFNPSNGECVSCRLAGT